MATKTVKAKTIEEVGNTPAGKLVSEEMIESAAKSAKARNAKTKEIRSGVGVLRKTGGGAGSTKLELSDIPYPEGIHGEDFELYGPMGQAAVIPDGVEIAPSVAEQEFVLDEDKVSFLSFDRPGRNLPKKRLYCVKAIHKDGTLVQLGWEAQIQNSPG